MLFTILINILFLVLTYSTTENRSCVIEDDFKEFVKSGRLPLFAKPINYYISYKFDRELESYKGHVKIDLEISQKTKFLVLHSDWNQIDSVILLRNKDNLAHISADSVFSDFCFVYENQYLVVKLSNYINPGDKPELTIYFHANVSSFLEGIYSSYYKTKTQTQKKIVSTQFEPNTARLAFPCFDEPSFKSIFHLEMIAPKTHKILSNSEISSQLIMDDYFILTRFYPTVKMSTYLLAFVIHQYESMEVKSKGGTKISVWLPQEHIEYGKFALGIAPEVVDLYEKLFGIKYQLSKIDLVGIPGFRAGAMENWGLITFRLTDILINEKSSSIADKINVAQTVTHELAHQWFGNLVTMKWWNDVWLNEGFATFMELYSVNKLRPEYRTQYAFNDIMIEAMEFDQMVTAHALSISSNITKDIHSLFEPISYKKGASVLFMLINSLGEDKFFKCVQTYLEKYAFSNADSVEFWSVIKKETGDEKYFEMMMTWTTLIGFPLISLTRDKSSNSIRLSQERMLLTHNIDQDIEKSDGKDGSLWTVPIIYTIESKPSIPESRWLKDQTSVIPLASNESWIKINYHFSDFYRTNYETEIIEAITKSLLNNVKCFSTPDKMSLISDLYTMLSLGKQNVKTTFDHFEYLKFETDTNVLYTFFKYMRKILTLVNVDKDLDSKFREYVLGFSNIIVDNLGWKHYDDYFNRQLQALGISTNIAFGHEKTITKAGEMFTEYLKTLSGIDVDLIYPLACGYIKNQGKDGFDKILSLYKSTTDPTLGIIYMRSLSCTTNTDDLKKFLELILSDTIPLQDKIYAVQVARGNPLTSSLALKYTLDNFDSMLKIEKNDTRFVAQTFGGIFSSINTRKDLKAIKEFFEKNKFDAKNVDVKLSLETIKINIYWMEHILVQLKEYFPNAGKIMK